MSKKAILVPALVLLVTATASAAVPGATVVQQMDGMLGNWGATGVSAVLAVGGIAAWFSRDFIHDLAQHVGKGALVGVLCVAGPAIVTYLGIAAAGGAVLF